MNQLQFEAITEWQKSVFKNATAFSKLQHLKEEIEELEIDLDNDSINKRLEYADCFILLFGAAAADGMTYENICDAIQEKHEINKVRKWGKPDINGVIKHCKN